MPLITQFDTTMNLLQKVLDLRSTNQQVIGSNIANAETPGYSSVSFEFEEQLKAAMNRGDLSPIATQPGHIGGRFLDLSQVNGEMVVHPDRRGIGDGNSVSVDEEMVKLSENQILYEAAITMLNKKLALLKYAASDGK